MMLPKCEVDGCEDYCEHTLGIGSNVAVGVCRGHRKPARRLTRKYGVKLLETVADIHDEFMNAVSNIKEKE